MLPIGHTDEVQHVIKARLVNRADALANYLVARLWSPKPESKAPGAAHSKQVSNRGAQRREAGVHAQQRAYLRISPSSVNRWRNRCASQKKHVKELRTS